MRGGIAATFPHTFVNGSLLWVKIEIQLKHVLRPIYYLNMRLIDSKSLEIHEFGSSDVPEYAILSHRWGKDEVTLQQMQNWTQGKAKRRGDMIDISSLQGFQKIQQCCSRVIKDGLKYVWIDTCCIDKTSSSELSESINSMYQWYFQAERCYAYLADVSSVDSIPRSEWFNRGWTLQELLAPSEVYILDQNWTDLGTRESLQDVISRVTNIPQDILTGKTDLESASAAQRMSWAASRQTTRLEDRAYCLMGIFGINMPLIYGEGEQAFGRLQQEIVRVFNDHTLLAWKSADSRGGAFATSPTAFKDCGNIVRCNEIENTASYISLSSIGVHIDVRFMGFGPDKVGLAILDCTEENARHDSVIAIAVRDTNVAMKSFQRIQTEMLTNVNLKEWRSSQYPMRRLCLETKRILPWRKSLATHSGSAQFHFYERATLTQVMQFSDPMAIMRAAERGSEDHCWILLTRSDVSVDVQDAAGNTALIMAARNGHHSIMRFLLQMGANINTVTTENMTALHHAAKSSHDAAVRELLDGGAYIEAKDATQSTPLALAIKNGSNTVVSTLLQRGADVNIVDESGMTPLHVAAQYGNSAAATLLLSYQAPMEVKDHEGYTPLLRAVDNGHKGMTMTLLEEGADVDATTTLGVASMYLAVQRNDADMVQLLISKGADTRAKQHNGDNVLISAIKRGSTAIVKQLLDKGVSVTSQEAGGETLIHIASERGEDDILSQLIAKGADVNAKNVSGVSPLWKAVVCNRYSTVAVLVKHGADIHATIDTEKTVMQWAIENRRSWMLVLLLRLGARTNNQTGPVWDLMQWSAENSHDHVVEALLDDHLIENEDLTWTPLHWSAERGLREVMELQISQNVDINATDGMGQTPLHWAARCSQYMVLSQLVAHRANLDIIDNSGSTPLYVAVEYGDLEIASTLLDAGAQVNHPQTPRKLPLCAAVEASDVGMVALLLQHGANADVNDAYGCKILVFAVSARDENIVRLLLEHGADAKSKDVVGKTVLMNARASQSTSIINLLLEHGAETGVVESGPQSNLSAIDFLYQSLSRTPNAEATPGQAIAPTSVETMMETFTQLLNDGPEARRNSPFLQAALQLSQRNYTLPRRSRR